MLVEECRNEARSAGFLESCPHRLTLQLKLALQLRLALQPSVLICEVLIQKRSLTKRREAVLEASSESCVPFLYTSAIRQSL